MRQATIALLVSQKYEQSPYRDDLLLQDRLVELGHSVDIIDWDSRTYDFGAADLCIIRSCWDFHHKPKLYLEKLKQISQGSILINSIALLGSYTNKRYLLNLETKGIPIVPTAIIRKPREISVILPLWNTKQIVIKPTISASGDSTYRLDADNISTIDEALQHILPKGDAIVQPYIESIETEGEISTVVIDGEITFSMLKKPARGGFLVHEHHGGEYIPIEANAQQQSFVGQILSMFGEPPLYMRIDYLLDDAGKPMLLEIEINEPNLYLSQSDKTLQKFSQKIDRLVTKKVRHR